MRKKPEYFDRVQADAHRRWDQLEEDKDLAGPWWQLFRQIQSPRHVVSELLQNADDAEATWASVSIQDNTFVFEHDGHDFKRDEFLSLCRFGYSNKRSLLTIGFRGIGFKSTFSLGPKVELLTPTLSCWYDKGRFTEPQWLNDAEPATHTVIRVCLDSAQKATVLEEQVRLWRSSPVPLLFFRSIERLRLLGDEFTVQRAGKGPCPNSQRARISGVSDEIIVIESPEESFPKECLTEIQDERGDPSLELPPCSVTIVVGAPNPGRLHVVLPTEVTLGLPVACQAPFVQDPARLSIKDPALSPTNQWLLRRIGALMASSLSAWVEQTNRKTSYRVNAYRLLPNPSPDAPGSLPGASTAIVLEQFRKGIANKRLLVCTDGSLGHSGNTVALPAPVIHTWDPFPALRIFRPDRKKVLAEEVTATNLNRLVRWGLVESVEDGSILDRLQDTKLPPPTCPKEISRLLDLWCYLKKCTARTWRADTWWKSSNIVPAEGHKDLQRAQDLVPARPSSSKESHRAWAFILRHLDVVDEQWNKLMLSLEKASNEEENSVPRLFRQLSPEDRKSILVAWQATGLSGTSRPEYFVQRVVKKLFSATMSSPDDAMELTHICAEFNINLKTENYTGFRFLCRDGQWRGHRDRLIAPGEFDVDDLMPHAWIGVHAISDQYERGLSAQEVERFRQWTNSSKGGGLPQFPIPFSERETHKYGLESVQQFCADRGATIEPKLKSESFYIQDPDWEQDCWKYWDTVARIDPSLYSKIVSGVLHSWHHFGYENLHGEVKQKGNTTNHTVASKLQPLWLIKLKGCPCLPDTHGRLRIPAELYRRHPMTRALEDIEPFLHEEWDETDFHRALDLLGVRTRPGDANKLLERITALSGADAPPIGPLRDLYRALDRVMVRLDSDQQTRIVSSFRNDPLIFSTKGWRTTKAVFKGNPHDIPAVSVIHAEFVDLEALWDRLHVKAAPSLQDALEWYNSLAKDVLLDKRDRERVIELLTRYPEDIWSQTRTWLTVAGTLSLVKNLKWTCASRTIAAGLFDGTKMLTADISMAPPEDIRRVDNRMPPLVEGNLEQRIVRLKSAGLCPQENQIEWMRALGEILSRLSPSGGYSEKEVQADRKQGARLAQTAITWVNEIRVQSYLKGDPAGQEIDVPVVWNETNLYVKGHGGKVYKTVVLELARHFHSQDAKTAIADCVDRPALWIREYASQQLTLIEEAVQWTVLESSDIQSGRNESQRAEPGADDNDDALPKNGAKDEVLREPVDLDNPTVPDSDINETDIEGVETIDTDVSICGTRPRPHHQPSRLEKYMASLGFSWNEMGECFYHARGDVLKQNHDGMFTWIWIRNGKDTPVWIAEHSLLSEQGLIIPAEIWNIADGHNAILFEPFEDEYRERLFSDLRRDVNIKVFPCNYRLRLTQD